MLAFKTHPIGCRSRLWAGPVSGVYDAETINMRGMVHRTKEVKILAELFVLRLDDFGKLPTRLALSLTSSQLVVIQRTTHIFSSEVEAPMPWLSDESGRLTEKRHSSESR